MNRDHGDHELIEWVVASGFQLVQRELPTGQLAWVLTSDGDGPDPVFLTRRQALDYIPERRRRIAISE
jgi:hypothetical protein